MLFYILLFNSGLHEDEKAAIREKLLQAFVEPINQVSRVIVLAIVKRNLVCIGINNNNE